MFSAQCSSGQGFLLFHSCSFTADVVASRKTWPCRQDPENPCNENQWMIGQLFLLVFGTAIYCFPCVTVLYMSHRHPFTLLAVFPASICGLYFHRWVHVFIFLPVWVWFTMSGHLAAHTVAFCAFQHIWRRFLLYASAHMTIWWQKDFRPGKRRSKLWRTWYNWWIWSRLTQTNSAPHWYVWWMPSYFIHKNDNSVHRTLWILVEIKS